MGGGLYSQVALRSARSGVDQEEGDTIIRGGKAVEARCRNRGDEGVEAHQGAVGDHDESDR